MEALPCTAASAGHVDVAAHRSACGGRASRPDRPTGARPANPERLPQTPPRSASQRMDGARRKGEAERAEEPAIPVLELRRLGPRRDLVGAPGKAQSRPRSE